MVKKKPASKPKKKIDPEAIMAENQPIDFVGVISESANIRSVVLSAPDDIGISIRAIAISTTEPADFNGDGTVDSADYVRWRNRNGTVADYDLWRANFGDSIPASGALFTEIAAVPEPKSIALILGPVSLVCILTRRRHESAHFIPYRCSPRSSL